jgi:polysaccharide biosynthesis protein PslG
MLTLWLSKILLRGVSLIARLAVIWMLLRGLTPAAPRVTLGPRQTVETLHPAVCVHTRLTDEVEEWKIQRNMTMVREMGASTVVEFFPWDYAEHDRGTYDWLRFDRIMRHAQNQGLTVIARLGRVPEWARPPVQEKVTTFNYLPDNEFDRFAAFVEAFVERYRGQVGAIIIWNEPNLSFEWGGRDVDPAAYAELLRVTYAAAHQANPDIIVMGGALAPTNEPEGSSSMNDIRFLERLYEAGAAPYFDALAAHTYGFKNPPQDDPAPDVINFRRVELLREVMIRYGDGNKPVYITESGWSDDPRWANAVRPGQRITYTLDAFTLVESWPWAKTLCLWDFRQPVDRHNRRDAYYALVTSDFVRKPIYDAVQAYARGWPNPYLP